MGGGDLNLKKSWHPSTLRNIERVWKAEQKHEVEQQKIEQLQKELAEERAREEIQTFAEDQGVLRKKDERLDWMYQGPSAMVNRDEYLLGRKIDKTLETLTQMEKGVEPEKEEGVGIASSSMFSSQNLSGNATVDLAAKIREDPLFSIMKKEKEERKNLLTNPVKMKQLQEMLKASLNKSKSKKSKKNKKKKHQDSDSEEEQKYKKQKKQQDSKEEKQHKKLKKHKKSYSSESEEEMKSFEKYSKQRKDTNGAYGSSEKRSKRNEYNDDAYDKNHRDFQRKDINGTYESSEKRSRKNEYNDKTYDRNQDYNFPQNPKDIKYSSSHYKDSQANYEYQESTHNTSKGHKSYKIRSNNYESEFSSKYRRYNNSSSPEYSESRQRSSYYNEEISTRNSYSKSSKPKSRQDDNTEEINKKRKLDESEKERLLREMQDNAKWRDEQRKRNTQRYKEEEEREREKTVDKVDSDAFLKPLLSKAAGKGNLEDRIKQKIFTIQRSSSAMEKNFARRD